ncbi:MAG TPA: hypothetical protein VG710_10445 [Opitutus sp.]|nr:hypothetical protein [Opitutus sp.]
MNHARLILAAGFLAAVPLRAVYAPLPDLDQGKDWTVTVRAGVSHDSNIFGARESTVPGLAPISSTVYEVAPRFAFSGSLNDQTFAEFNYTLTVDHFTDRPGDKTLDSHAVVARIAHAFSADTDIDLSDQFQVSKNPESLLAGVTANTDQSYKLNEFDGRFHTSLAPKIGGAAKVRSILFRYDNGNLARSLDRVEMLYGLEGTYDLLPELKAVAEYRHEDVYYDTQGEMKNKRSDFAMAGFDYAVAKKTSLSGRLGGEWRTRSGQPDTDGPYAEFSAKYDYARNSFLTAGYVHEFEETSNVDLYNDTRVNRFFVNLQHALSALIIASGSVTFEPSVLQGRRGNPDRDETTTRLGLALSWVPTKHASISASYDHDLVNSDDPSRGQKRDRYGLFGAYAF